MRAENWESSRGTTSWGWGREGSAVLAGPVKLYGEPCQSKGRILIVPSALRLGGEAKTVSSQDKNGPVLAGSSRRAHDIAT